MANTYKRDWYIYFEWIRGKDYAELADQFNLSANAIKKICIANVPFAVRNSKSLSENDYARYREWKRKRLSEKKQHYVPDKRTTTAPVEQPIELPVEEDVQPQVTQQFLTPCPICDTCLSVTETLEEFLKKSGDIILPNHFSLNLPCPQCQKATLSVVIRPQEKEIPKSSQED